LQTYAKSLNAARESHELAAEDFKEAARWTDDVEALRLLRMLEENHRELARTLAIPNEGLGMNKIPESDEHSATDVSEDSKSNTTSSEPSEGATNLTPPPASTSPPLRKPPRKELASSIASNLAAMRGIPPQEREKELAKIQQKQRRDRAGTGLPSTAEVTAQHVGGNMAPMSKIPPSVMSAGRIPASPVTPVTAALAPFNANEPTSAGSDGFGAFYRNFESILSKMPASLAFAGLPLTSGQISGAGQTQESAKKENKTKTTSARATNEPDLSTIFSPATLKALRDDAGQGFGAHESFYLVRDSGRPTNRRGQGNQVDEEEDADGAGSDAEFVDARESLASSLTQGSAGPSSPRGPTRTSTGMGTTSGKKSIKKPVTETLSSQGKTLEELELENSALKGLLDNQARRLQMWEASAQSQSMALAQSLRLSRPRPGSSGSAGNKPAAGGDKSKKPSDASKTGGASELERLRDLVKELEDVAESERLRKESAEHKVEKMQREQERLLGVLGKYRDKWEMLKESARARERRKEEERVAKATGTS
jgi:hypothetical protein